MRFHHIGLVTDTEKPGETYYESLKVWGTNPDDDPVNRIEWVRFSPESPLAGTPVAQRSHISFHVDNLDEALTGKQVVVGPLDVGGGIRIAYFEEDEALIEYLEVTP